MGPTCSPGTSRTRGRQRERAAPGRRLVLLVGVLCLAAPLAAQLDADFLATPTSGSAPLTVHFMDATTGGTPVARQWDFGDGTVGIGLNPVHLYGAPGSYTVSYTVFGSGPGEQDTEVKPAYIQVQPVPLVAGFQAVPTSALTEHPVAFADTSLGSGIDAWNWSFGDGTASTLQNPTHAYSQPGSYTVGLTVWIAGQSDVLVVADMVTVKAPFAPAALVSGESNGPASVHAADLNGDELLDVLVAAQNDHEIAWHAQLPDGTFGARQLVGGLAQPRTVSAGDFDGDGDLDVLSASELQDELAWFENLDGQGTFGGRAIISLAADGPRAVRAADLDGDGRADALCASRFDHEVAWFRNEDGLGSFGPQQLLSSSVLAARAVDCADLDDDGDLDVLSAAEGDGQLAWYENLDGQGHFAPSALLPSVTSSAQDVHAADLDGDGDLDVLYASAADGRAGWIEHLDGQGSFSPQPHLLAPAPSARAVQAADLDRDGDLDVVVAQLGDYSSVWFENLDGAGGFALPQGVGVLAGAGSDVTLADLDRDGDADVIACTTLGDQVAWSENRIVDSAWTHLGGAAVGSAGPPALAGTGSLAPGSVVQLALTQAPPQTLMLAWLSFASQPWEVLGGTLYAHPQSAQVLMASDADGELLQTLIWPAGLPPGVTFWLQFLVQDTAIPAGITLSNAVSATTP